MSVGNRRREALVTGAVVRYFKAKQRAGAPLWYLKVHGGPFQRAGVPDLLVCVKGYFLGVELKAGGEHPTPRQVVECRSIARAGGRVMGCATTLDEVKQTVELMLLLPSVTHITKEQLSGNQQALTLKPEADPKGRDRCELSR